jgi:transposase-like protein
MKRRNVETHPLIEELVSQLKGPEDFRTLQDMLLKRGIESLLRAEMNEHLGYPSGEKPIESNLRNGYSQKTIKTSSGDQIISVPRDRNGEFEPIIVPKHKTMTKELEDCVLLLYAKGMSNADIVDFMDRTYGARYSTSSISQITNSLLEDIKEWQGRPLDDQYAVVWIDGIHYKIRSENQIVSKACMVVLGINTEGQQDILSLRICEKESAAMWAEMFDDLKSRGVQDIIFLCSDNLKGLDKAVEAVYPKAVRQICIVHQIRNSMTHVSYKDRKDIIKDMQKIYKASNIETAQEALEEFKQKWSNKYHLVVKSWETNWENLTAFIGYPLEIRKLIYTTNIIESFNASLRKFTKNKKVFPTDDAALKSIYLAAQQIRKKWEKTRFGWSQIYNQISIYFENRLIH